LRPHAAPERAQRDGLVHSIQFEGNPGQAKRPILLEDRFIVHRETSM
jgi:hypothetical protein